MPQAAEVSLHIESMMSAQQRLKSKWNDYRRGIMLDTYDKTQLRTQSITALNNFSIGRGHRKFS